MSDTGFSALDEELISAVAAGRGVLLLGQDHSGGLVDEVLRDVAAALRSDKATDLRSQLVDRVKVDDLPNVLRALSLHSADEQLIETVTQPWSMILTSAVDPMGDRSAPTSGHLGASAPHSLPVASHGTGRPCRTRHADSSAPLRFAR